MDKSNRNKELRERAGRRLSAERMRKELNALAPMVGDSELSNSLNYSVGHKHFSNYDVEARRLDARRARLIAMIVQELLG